MKKEIKKVIDFIQDCGAVKDGGICVESCTNDYLAELLIANNVVKLPAKIGATVWGVLAPCGGCSGYNYDAGCAVCEKAFAAELKFDWEDVPLWGKEVFATKEEAEAAATLKRGETSENSKDS